MTTTPTKEQIKAANAFWRALALGTLDDRGLSGFLADREAKLTDEIAELRAEVSRLHARELDRAHEASGVDPARWGRE